MCPYVPHQCAFSDISLFVNGFKRRVTDKHNSERTRGQWAFFLLKDFPERTFLVDDQEVRILHKNANKPTEPYRQVC
jgi:hypothetical protein